MNHKFRKKLHTHWLQKHEMQQFYSIMLSDGFQTLTNLAGYDVSLSEMISHQLLYHSPFSAGLPM